MTVWPLDSCPVVFLRLSINVLLSKNVEIKSDFVLFYPYILTA